MKKKLFAGLAVGVMVFCAVLQQANASTIDISDGDANAGAGSWGPGTASYGQTFTVPAGESLLNNYTFKILSMNDTFPFVSQVYAWNGYAIVGPELYTSDVVISPTPSAGYYTPYSFNPSIPVVAGQQYIAIVTNSPDGVSIGGPTDGTVGGMMLLAGNNPYAGGYFGFSGDLNPVTSHWNTISFYDAMFRAEFSAVPEPVPEPATMLLLGPGLASLAGIRIRSKKMRECRSQSRMASYIGSPGFTESSPGFAEP